MISWRWKWWRFALSEIPDGTIKLDGDSAWWRIVGRFWVRVS